ncbi:MAG: exonuclease SbcCD subunit D C-terminal domain-containing protein [Candidatus Sabulitectum sp.]|nr:exonuclease SbcCD subunit D C-terminal domain-containing protein [Candidatus Sabulitectum sp.]
MRILHTSDWHIGRKLYRRKRYDEFDAFLNWLEGTIHRKEVDALLVSGDVFDTSTPGNRAQELYYRFLCRVAASPCRHVVVTAGNHDSPTFLTAPSEILRTLNVHVIGSITENISDEVLVLKDHNGIPELIICSVPYLRDRDIRKVEAGESIDDKKRKIMDGIQGHYSAVCSLADEKCQELGGSIPIVAMGHLFTTGARTIDGDGVRELYVGSLAHVGSEMFPECIDYLALGHLHIPQKVAGLETMRYSGSPIPMGFGEASQEKSICLIDFSSRKAEVSLEKVPVFQQLERIRGNWDEISGRILQLSRMDSSAWLQVEYNGSELMGDLQNRLNEAVSSTNMEILRVTNLRVMNHVLDMVQDVTTLDNLSAGEVFEKRMDAAEVPEEQRRDLVHTYREAINSLVEEDTQKE